jgi:hypothetical protein
VVIINLDQIDGCRHPPIGTNVTFINTRVPWALSTQTKELECISMATSISILIQNSSIWLANLWLFTFMHLLMIQEDSKLNPMRLLWHTSLAQLAMIKPVVSVIQQRNVITVLQKDFVKIKFVLNKVHQTFVVNFLIANGKKKVM